ncbi:MAG: SH3 domain-containing protein, partial [Anaerolineae bacterium]|nr:SH3 domain-containing protein [Anaerolineae bacterium]
MMRRLCFRALLLICMFGMSAAASAAPRQQSGDLLAQLTTRTNLRAGGGVEWRIVGTYAAGTPIRLDGMAFDGTWVRGIVPDGTVGWVLTESLNISREQAAGLRGIWVDEPFTLSAPGGGPPPPASAPANEAAPEQPVQPSSAPAAPPSSGGIATTTANGVNLRTEPDGQVIRGLKFGEPVTVDGKHPNGTWVRVITADGARGYVVTSFVVLTPEQYTALPVVEGGASGPAPAAAAPANEAAPDAPPLAAIANTAPVSGFNLGGHINSLNANTAGRMQQSGMTWVKRQWRYLRGQPGDSVGGIVDEAHANGFRILIGIVGLPGELNQP